MWLTTMGLLAVPRTALAVDNVVEIQLDTQEVLATLRQHGLAVGRDCPDVIEGGGSET